MLPSDHHFFGLTPEYDQKIMDQCFDLGYYSKGSFTFDSAYQLPVNLRSYFWVKLWQKLEEENKAIENAQKQGKG